MMRLSSAARLVTATMLLVTCITGCGALGDPPCASADVDLGVQAAEHPAMEELSRALGLAEPYSGCLDDGVVGAGMTFIERRSQDEVRRVVRGALAAAGVAVQVDRALGSDAPSLVLLCADARVTDKDFVLTLSEGYTVEITRLTRQPNQNTCETRSF